MQQSPHAPGLLGYGFALSIFIAPFVLLPSLSEFANLPQAAWLQATTLFFLSLFLLSMANRKDGASLRISPLLLPMAALLLWCFIGLSYAVNPYEVIKRLSHLLAAAAAFFLVPQLYNTTDKIKTLLWAITLSGLGVALIGICQHLFSFSLIPQVSPPAATFANKNMAAHFVVLTIPAGIMLFLLERERFAYFLPIAMALQVTYLSYARTRASWLALFVELFLFTLFFLAFRKRNVLLRFSNHQKKGLILGLLLVFCLVGLGQQMWEGGGGEQIEFSGYSTMVSRIADSQAYVKEPGKQVRFALWLNTLAMARDNIITGVGLGNFKIHYPLFHNALLTDHSFSVNRQAVDSHNDLLQGIAELGFVGLTLFFWLSVRTTDSVIGAMQCQKGAEQIIVGMAAFGLMAFLVIAMFSFPMACSLPPFLTALYLGLLVSFSNNSKILLLPRTKHLIYGAIVCGITILFGTLNYKEIRADHYLAQFIDLESQQKWSEAILIGQKMVKEQPLRHQLISYLGRAYMNSGALPRAEKAFQIALRRSPGDINTMTNLGAVYSMRKMDAKAITTLERVVAIYPNHWGAHNNLGNVWMKQGEYSKAETAFQKATESNKTNHLLWYNLGNAAKAVGDKKKARNAFNRTLEIKPNWSPAQEMLYQNDQK